MSQTERAPIALFGGVGKGIAYMVGRIVTGVYETVTFPVPIPPGYRPIIEPDVPIPRGVDSGSGMV
jgi:putative exosortase-associated protein (TIGR04073 family)